MKKIYISEEAYNKLNEADSHVDTFRAKIKGILIHLNIFKDMSDDEIAALIGKHDWIDEKLTTAYDLTKQISHYSNYKTDFYDDELQEEELIDEKKGGKKDACYHKVKSRYKVFPSAYAGAALAQCREKGAENWGNKS